ncbi:hypothetical protein HPB52_021445 [Rhipicephalus sanguineus]|uniref:Uncharacterized protein n=1 Tax=Rhipicephalus sanguineus TaxID=34632 RepID=A0A9D4PTL9_RHISA|nr:hypothetical protein HPB52_021445 [Rhipicephalus sanguineus]
MRRRGWGSRNHGCPISPRKASAVEQAAGREPLPYAAKKAGAALSDTETVFLGDLSSFASSFEPQFTAKSGRPNRRTNLRIQWKPRPVG